jgi:homoserine kinase
MHLELEVAEAGEFAVDTGGLEVAADRSNLCVRAFEALHPADGLHFSITTEIPLARGLGSSAAAIVAGLLAADHMFELDVGRDELYRRAVDLEGHPDNVAAALFGGFVACPDLEGGERPGPVLLDPPQGLEAVIVIPDEEVPTSSAREALPDQVAFGDALVNVSAMAQLMLGIERSDPGLIARGLADRLHQPARRELYPRSLELVEQAPSLGAIGATISGAGPSVLVWCFWQDTGKVMAALEERYIDWADIRRVPFTPDGAEVTEL